MAFTIPNSIDQARKNFSFLKNDGFGTSIGDIWSIKKLLILDYYLPSFKTICSPKNNFREWYYIDPFCGSGLFSFKDKDLKTEVFPGSGLLGTYTSSKNDYTNCILSDKDPKVVKALNSRLTQSRLLLKGKSYKAEVLEFEDAVENILQVKKFGTAILVFLDPAGYTPIKWELMKRLLKPVGVDIILNFYTHRIAQNVSASKTKPENEKNLNEFFGDEEWKQFRTSINKQKLGNKLLKFYLDKIKNISGKNTIEIGVYKEGKNKLYDLIVITRSSAGARVIKKAQEIMNNATTKTIKSEFKVQIKKQKTLFDD